jgi:Tfp pilus assembly pilus retraction ATPase PilT
VDKYSLDEVYIDEVLQHAIDARCVDVYLEVGQVPTIRRQGELHLRELDMYEILRADVTQRMIYDVLTDEQIVELERSGSIMLRYVTADRFATYHANVTHDTAAVEATFHLVSLRTSPA